MSSPSSSSPQQHDGAAGNASASTSSRSAASPSAASSSASGRGRGKALADARVSEELEIALNLALERFWYSDDQEMSFPSSFTSTERAFIHRLCQSLGLISKSKGKGSSRYLTVRKKNGSEVAHAEMTCCLTPRTKQTVHSLIHRFPLTNKERIELLPKTQRGNAFAVETENKEVGKTSGRLSSGIPQVPLKRGESEYDSFRQSLPVFEKKEEIVKIIKENKVVLIVGETGSGKTTQIPQFLLDDCYENGVPCRIFCTQPRRLAVIAVAERVAAERREKVGQTVGYQIRLESRVSPRTLLTFCTNGILLRTLMAGDSALSTVTHVIVDEVHERDRFSDFLLIKLRDILQNQTNLKLIISSAALDANLFIKYFGSCPVIHIQGRPFEVKEMFLEDILRSTGYTNKEMIKYKKEKQREEKQQSTLTEWCCAQENSSNPESRRRRSVASVSEEYNLLDSSGDTVFNHLIERDTSCLEPWLIKEMDSCLSDIWLHKDIDSFAQVFHFILTENVSVDYRHSETSATALMIASGRGFLSQVEQLISMGASVHCKSSNGWMALDWAKHFGQTEVVDLLESYSASMESGNLDESSLVQASGNDLGAEDRELLKAYHHSFDDEKVDLDLIMHLLYNICNSSDGGAILIFLPGYDEIISLRDRIIFDDKRFVDNAHRYQVFMLHSNMQTLDQKNVLKTPPSGIRKIILSTNIAETSITVNDVVFVIDSGKMKEKSFDALSCVTMLKTVWISKASAIQRRGRAGRCRPGVCFHLFSRLRFQNMLEFQTPELRRMPLQELCLHTKLLAPVNCPVVDFLMKAPDPPPALIVRNAIQMLKKIDAMDVWEDLTELGYHLAELPVEPHLGKMVLCAVVLKCLDPILTIACTLAYRDPFVLPTVASQKRAAMLCRKRLAAGTFSDHMVLLRAFQAWQKARSDGWERVFCEKNFLSQATMEIIIGMRTQLLGQLRALGFVRARGGADIRDVNVNSENWAVVKAALVAGMYPNLVHVDRENLVLTGPKEKKVRFHPTSVLSQAQYKKIPPSNGQAAAVQALPTDWLIYDEMTRAHRIANIRCCSVVTPVTVALFSGPARLPRNALQEPLSFRGNRVSNDNDSDSGMEDERSNVALLKLDEWLHFKLDSEVAGLLMQLKLKWHSLLLRRMRAPSKPWSQADEITIRAIISVLSTEEQFAGLLQPSGVGQRPRPVSYNELPSAPTWRSSSSSAETELSDDSSNAEKVLRKSAPPAFHQPRRHKEKNVVASKRTSDEKSDQSSVKSTDSSCYPSPCVSPSPVSGKGSKTPSPRLSMPVRYFIMKSSNLQNLDISQQKGIWSTTPSNEQKLNRAFWESSLVYLIFSVQGSGHFQGFARMSSEIGCEQSQCWGSTGLGGVFKVEWIRKESIPFQFTHHLLNPWNDNKEVQISRDGQELEPQIGEQLLKLWDHTSAVKASTDNVK
ncbi:3'-5' RNA helicase YTHDC2 isoform X2 [Gallus gallus]|uniref:3'-5' RNA helicase YTHDC2 n=1 Tax=Gallus gallus TaxID=9031 RepID=A0A8V0Y1J8_CHICK|nr:3'-5' RNA helicase YTHDC2 isoform X2 [Gallus gallus]XP_046791806.1 3'-5' RNA helicase YTHDC2 isoform X2 [Gallus gallus]|eukprot:XP_025000689.1 probable ATP-dependent RNA helicase YTHDC2 isoform X2 [Gallus gallus]